MLHLLLAGLWAFSRPTDPPCGDQSQGVVAFVDVTVIPMDRERRLPGQTVVVRGDRIVELGPVASVKVPEGATRVEGKGKFLIPGLAEMHAHIPGGQAADSAVERTLLMYLAGGLTTVRGMLGHPRHLELRARAARGVLLSPTIYAAGPSLNGNSIPDPAAARKAVIEQKEAGYDLLKIHPGVSRESFDTLVATARRVGIPFAGHVPTEVGVAHAIESKYATIEHLDGYIEAMIQEGAPVTAEQSAFFGLNLGEHLDGSKLPALVEATTRAGVWNVPTQVLLENPSHHGNLGAAVRAAAAAGASAVLTTGRLEPWHPAALRGSAGLHYALPVVRIEALPASSRPLLALDPGGEPLHPGAIPAAVDLTVMSRSVIMPTSRRPSQTGREPTFNSSISRAASLTVRSGWMTRTSRVITSAIFMRASQNPCRSMRIPRGEPRDRTSDQCGRRSKGSTEAIVRRGRRSRRPGWRRSRP